MKQYQKLNNVIGWFTFLIAAAVFLMTAEPTASWWDCGEYIATAFKLQVGHPPGAPTFQLFGRIFSLFAFGDVTKVAYMVNAMSALMSALTILFLFWSITLLGKKLVLKHGEMTMPKMIAIFASGFIGALAYTFSDSFWFSAVEGEVYATSSFFTALVFWVILKWESISEEKHSFRWIILISFLIGISIGVHLLNLLAIPAIVFVYYFKNFKTTTKGNFISISIALIMLAVILWGIIPWIVNLAGKFELFFINGVGLPFNSGTIIYFILIITGIVVGIRYTTRKKKVVVNTILVALIFILVGYSSFFILIIRANANTPINENNPSDAIGLLSYLNREQYGENPLVYGQYFTAKPIGSEKGSTKYVKGKDKYEEAGSNYSYKYDDKECTIFPRMYSNDDSRQHPAMYKVWADIHGDRKPTFSENVKFFFSYQLGHMYFRYFMWNFVGRQNDIQGHGYDVNGNKEIMNGNWISGIKSIDAMRLGNQDNLPANMLNNKARNTFYFLPLILGLIGMYYQYKKNAKDMFVVFLLFFFTGLAIAIYLNMPPMQPRERDYAFAGSFYAFAIWIGLGVMAIFDFLSKQKVPAMTSVIIATVVSFFSTPYLMAKGGWDDHDRSNKYSARDIAVNYLNSCAPNAILITNGDNDTFPLWYAQEVEGVRTDVRVVNYTLASGAWYVEQLFKKMYDSPPLPFTLPIEKYKQGCNDYVPVSESNIAEFSDLKQVIDFVNSDSPEAKATMQDGQLSSYVPTNKVKLIIDSAYLISKGIVSKDKAGKFFPSFEWTISKGGLFKNETMFLDFLATNKWQRPVYFVNPSSVRNIANISDYCQQEGVVYRLLPYASDNRSEGFAGVSVDATYDLLVNKSKWGNLNKPHVYVDPESFRSCQVARSQYARLAQALIIENKKDSAVKVLDKANEFFPNEKIAYDIYMISHIQLYYNANAFDKGNKMAEIILNKCKSELEYFDSLEAEYRKSVAQERAQAVYAVKSIAQICNQFKQDALIKKIELILKAHPDM
ncbi:MAG: DUF2723 domain-containing protein [Bacteroidetes bacterium]|nr:DUF2723 domain-containing protein [Bacteroidota bacterium]